MSSVRTVVKKLQAAVEGGESKDVLNGLFTTAQSALAKAGAKGLLHKNNASRRIARLAALLTRVEADTAKGTKTKVATAASLQKKSAKKSAGKKKTVTKKQKKVVKKSTKAATKKKKKS